MNLSEAYLYLEKFLSHLKRKNYSIETIKLYRHYTDKFIQYLNLHGKKDIKAVNRKTITEYQSYLEKYKNKNKKPYSETTKENCIKSLRQFFGYLKKENMILLDPMEGMPSLTRSKRHPKCVLSQREMQNILIQPNTKTILGFRDRTVLELLYSTGIRRTELIHVNIYDVDMLEGLLRVTQGKGKKDRVVPIGKAAVKYIKEYLTAIRPKLQKKHVQTKALFLNRTGKALSSQDLGHLVSKYAKQTAIAKPISPHAFRHTCATEMLKGGCSVRYVQEMLGHAHIKTTQIYTRVVPIDLKNIYKKTHPRERKKNKTVPSFNRNKKISFFCKSKQKNK
jgi:integrase/recombinase XerD